MPQWTTRTWWTLLWLVAVLIGGLPLLACQIARMMGHLPPIDGSQGGGGNHTEWWGTWQDTLLTLNWLIGLPLWLVVCAFVSALLAWFERRWNKPFLRPDFGSIYRRLLVFVSFFRPFLMQVKVCFGKRVAPK